MSNFPKRKSLTQIVIGDLEDFVNKQVHLCKNAIEKNLDINLVDGQMKYLQHMNKVVHEKSPYIKYGILRSEHSLALQEAKATAKLAPGDKRLVVFAEQRFEQICILNDSHYKGPFLSPAKCKSKHLRKICHKAYIW